MVSATVNSVTTNFTYRGDGLRDSRAVSGGATTTFTWDIAGGLPVVLDDGNQYLYGAGLTAQKQSGSWYYYLADGLGSTMAVVTASGVAQDSYTYDVYGKPTRTGSLANEFDFAGQQTDGTGLQYLRARYYDPATGTFLSRDPLAALPGSSANAFAYGECSPGRFTDSSGLKPTDGGDYDEANLSRAQKRCLELLFRVRRLTKEMADQRTGLEHPTGRPLKPVGRDSVAGKLKLWFQARDAAAKEIDKWDKRDKDDNNCSDELPQFADEIEAAKGLLHEYPKVSDDHQRSSWTWPQAPDFSPPRVFPVPGGGSWPVPVY